MASAQSDIATTAVDDVGQETRPRRPRGAQRSNRWWVGAVVVEAALFFAIWETLSRVGVIPPNFLPPPSEIADAFVGLFGLPDFWANIRHTLTNLVVGLVIASSVGIAVGLGVGWFRILEITVGPLLWILYVTPKVALAPLVILWLGIGSSSQIALVVLLAIYPLMLNTLDGVKTTDPSLISAARVFGIRGTSLFAKVVLPGTLPFVLVGLRRGIALGFIGAILGEFLGGSAGIGKTLQLAVFNFRLDDALAIVAIMVLVTNAALKSLDIARGRLMPWSSTGPAGG